MNKKQKAITLGIMCLLLTMATVIQIKTINGANQVASSTFTSNNLRDQVLKWKERYDTTYSSLQTSEKRLEDVREQASDNTEGSSEKEEELKRNNMLLGLTDVTGEGVIVTLKDNDKVTASTTLGDISEYIVHYSDILGIVNELKNAGAEAISVNDVRVVNMTEFADIYGYIIMKPSQRITSPYVIKAIGSQTQLINTLSIKETGFIDYRTSQGKTVKLEKQRNIKIPKYTGEIEVRYMKEVED